MYAPLLALAFGAIYRDRRDPPKLYLPATENNVDAQKADQPIVLEVHLTIESVAPFARAKQSAEFLRLNSVAALYGLVVSTMVAFIVWKPALRGANISPDRVALFLSDDVARHWGTLLTCLASLFATFCFIAAPRFVSTILVLFLPILLLGYFRLIVAPYVSDAVGPDPFAAEYLSTAAWIVFAVFAGVLLSLAFSMSALFGARRNVRAGWSNYGHYLLKARNPLAWAFGLPPLFGLKRIPAEIWLLSILEQAFKAPRTLLPLTALMFLPSMLLAAPKRYAAIGRTLCCLAAWTHRLIPCLPHRAWGRWPPNSCRA